MNESEYLKKLENLQKAIDDLSWSIIISIDHDKQDLAGLVIGKQKFINKMMKIMKSSDIIQKSKKNSDDDPTLH